MDTGDERLSPASQQRVQEARAKVLDYSESVRKFAYRAGIEVREMLEMSAGPFDVFEGRLHAFATLCGDPYEGEMIQLTRADGAKAWRAPLGDDPDSLCLHYWRLPASGETELIGFSGWYEGPLGDSA